MVEKNCSLVFAVDQVCSKQEVNRADSERGEGEQQLENSLGGEEESCDVLADGGDGASDDHFVS